MILNHIFSTKNFTANYTQTKNNLHALWFIDIIATKISGLFGLVFGPEIKFEVRPDLNLYFRIGFGLNSPAVYNSDKEARLIEEITAKIVKHLLRTFRPSAGAIVSQHEKAIKVDYLQVVTVPFLFNVHNTYSDL